MLHLQQLAAELERKREALSAYQDDYRAGLDAYRAALRSLAARYPSAAALGAAQSARLSLGERPHSAGAQATAEYDAWARASAGGWPLVPFGRHFAHHAEARAWAEERLAGVTTFAVDGSQLPPWRDASIPVALVQVALFENPHDAARPYTKDVTAELLTPEDLIVTRPDTADLRTGQALTYSTQLVNLRRFELETRTLVARMERHAARRAAGEAREGTVVAFYDGSLIVSFALSQAEEYRERYVQASQRLLAVSAETRIPLVGYIDTSYARDLLTMLGGLAEAPNELPQTRGLHDALLWHRQMAWGDRSLAFISARDDLASMGYAAQAHDVAFVYLQTASDRPPARIEFPRWVLEAGLLDAVVDVVRAETVAGTGYPYAIETADAAAVIRAADRAQFYALFQAFVERAGLSFTFSHKALSKSRRRS
ncbi:MAG TPA: DNA double-strand break repair nuclease NurA [Ktedonobacterales bacterium]|nr:DNA double-strand break repair nuclease NurA [Ktedonobacterales bacterium]